MKITKEFLEEEYINKKRSMTDIANEIGCSWATIDRKFKKFGIKKDGNRNFQEKHKLVANITEAELRKHIIDEYLSYAEIAGLYQDVTPAQISELAKKFKIKRNKEQRAKFMIISRNEKNEFYRF